MGYKRVYEKQFHLENVQVDKEEYYYERMHTLGFGMNNS